MFDDVRLALNFLSSGFREIAVIVPFPRFAVSRPFPYSYIGRKEKFYDCHVRAVSKLKFVAGLWTSFHVLSIMWY